MTIWYFDSVNGSDSNDGKSIAQAKKSYAQFRQNVPSAPGDTFLFKRGTTQKIDIIYTSIVTGIDNNNRSRYGAYGDAQVPYSIWQNPSGDGNFILNASGRSYVVLEDMYFDGQGICPYSLYLVANGATPCVGHRISRCYFTNMKTPGSGLVPGATATSTGEAGDYLIEDCHFFDNPVHGMLVNGANNVRVRRCHFYRNGFDAPAGGHGFSAKFRRSDAPGGWTNTNGTIWQRPLATYELDVFYVRSSISSYGRLEKNTVTPTAPSAGQFGVSTGILYINVNSTANPAGQGINYAWGPCRNLIVEHCEAYQNISDPQSPSAEGHGFAFDDYTESSIFRGNLSHDNEGAGFSVNRGDNNKLISNIAYRNGLAGIVGAACRNTSISHNTLFDNNKGSNSYQGEITLFTHADGSISNNIMKATKNGKYAVDIYSPSSFSGSSNCAYGYLSASRGGVSLQNTIITDPLLDELYLPHSPDLRGAGTYLGDTDYNGRYFYDPPTIGAVDDETAYPRYLLMDN